MRGREGVVEKQDESTSIAEEASRGVPLLLHACCGPCSIEPVLHLRQEGFEPTICWTNPNIAPRSEHDLRLRTLMQWARDVAHVRVIVADEDSAAWEAGVAPFGLDRARRCRACYAQRLATTCRTAVDQGFSYVSTTLAVSPYQLFDSCHDVLSQLAAHFGLTAVWRDFRLYYPDATKCSRELQMYRQNYCGCRFSAAEAAISRQELRDARKAARARARAQRTFDQDLFVCGR